MELTGKVALVTGAGSGIGKATTVLLAKQGARVAALSHTADEIQATAEEIQRGGGEAMAVSADISQEEQMQRFWIGYLPNNAASGRGIEKAGFHIVSDLVVSQGHVSGITLFESSEQAQASADFFCLPVVTEAPKVSSDN